MSGASTFDRPPAPHVLFAILDWGMGHATRTWPLIVSARKLGARVTIASRGTAGVWLDARMAEWDRLHPQAGGAAWSRVEKPGVTIRYAQGRGTLPRIALQMPGFVRSIAAERNWTTAFAAEHGVTHVFSDNCYGARAELPGVTNVFLSHQLNPPVPAAVRGWATSVVRRYAEAFDEVWVPDTEDCILAGRLAHAISAPTRYIGPLSRFQVEDKAALEPLDDAPVLLGLVSGPEPQRTTMEQDLRTCFQRDRRPALILAGRPGGGEHRTGNVLTVNDADDARFRQAVLAADTIICRSGYSTLLDLAVLGRTAVLVPTVGQPEQESLAREWARLHGWTELHASELAAFEPGEARGRPVQVAGPGPEALMQDWLQLASVTELEPAS